MSVSMTLRRFAPEDAPQEPGDEAAEFALGLKGITLLEGPEVLHFFDDWHVVHYLSTGTDWDRTLPGGFLIGGDLWHEIHPEEDPPRLLSAEAVKAAQAHLAALPHTVLDARLAALHGDVEIYHKPATEAEDGLVRGAFGTIRDFITAAAEADQAVLMTMT
ncbi:DUF1877 family protein [Primorskyibacter sp. 2E107]|uniref:DUF1877 family protein n=1 Tax=Primorskyibacter sp. 2E107 TaxID=3403458 RepID=UPI003AF5EA37